MPYLFVDDDSHEADEYVSNYIYFDENDPRSIQEALRIARARGGYNTVQNEAPNSESESFPAFASLRPLNRRF